MKKVQLIVGICLGVILMACQTSPEATARSRNFNSDWKFNLGEVSGAASVTFDDTSWRSLNLPHDWAIEGNFDKNNPAGFNGGALPGGLGWYRKTFNMHESDKGKKVFVDFDGAYMKTTVYLNGDSIGFWPYGYSSFRFDLTPYLKFDAPNVIAVKVDNSQQPNSRWYSGSGIYRNVWLTVVDPVHVDHWGTYVTTPEVTNKQATFQLRTTVKNDNSAAVEVEITSRLLNANGKEVGMDIITVSVPAGERTEGNQKITLGNPHFWDIDDPYLYNIETELRVDGKLTDTYTTTTGVRTFRFDAEKGFFLNGKNMKINGVCMHHDLGCLGAAVNIRALERQLEILKEMGCNAIRCSHNPPAPEQLDLCDRMGFIVMDETFDMWRKRKTRYDYGNYFDEWHERDLDALIMRDRNHPSVLMWSVGNEVYEQWTHADRDTLSIEQANIVINFGYDDFQLSNIDEGMNVNKLLCKKLADRARVLDPTRPVTVGCNEPRPNNNIFGSGALDIIGLNYFHAWYDSVPKNFPGKAFLATETVSGLMTRGYYKMPGDSMFVWPYRGEKYKGMKLDPVAENYSCSSYDNCHVPWGTYHENSMRLINKHDFISGQFVWTGFDYLGEPTPFQFPARSSNFGIVDLAGFPKDIYYMYQSQWSDKAMLHLFPHWNWEEGQEIDLWAYYNNADEVELFVNGVSQGTKSKEKDIYHVSWRVRYVPGTIKAVSRKDGKVVLEKEIHTAGEPAGIRLTADRTTISADGTDLSFVTVEVVDKDGNLCPNADNLINFDIDGNAFIAGVDNGCAYSMERFKDNKRKAFYGKCLVVLQNNGSKGKAKLTATADGLTTTSLTVRAK